MSAQENVPSLIDTRGKKGRSAHVGMNALHQAAVGLSDFRRGGSRFKTKDLVGLLLGHGSRAMRASLPLTTVRVKAFAPDGKAAVKISL